VGKEIPIEEAEKLLLLCEKESSTKSVWSQNRKHTYEVDEFYGANEGLTVAEIELESESETFTNQTGLE
jgi:adenylate cyclase